MSNLIVDKTDPLYTGLSCFLPVDEVAGSVLEDISDSGALHNGAIGASNSFATFDGKNVLEIAGGDVVTITDHPDFGTDGESFSFDLWVNAEDSNSVWNVLIDHGYYPGWTMQWAGWNGILVSHIRTQNGLSTGYNIDTPTTLQHVVYVYDNPNLELRIYINGALQSTHAVTDSSTIDSAANVLIGSANAGQTVRLARYRHWRDRVLTPAEVSTLYNNYDALIDAGGGGGTIVDVSMGIGAQSGISELADIVADDSLSVGAQSSILPAIEEQTSNNAPAVIAGTSAHINGASPVSPETLAYDSGAGGNDRCLIVTVGSELGNNEVSSITYGGQALTLLSHNTNTVNTGAFMEEIFVYYLLDPPTGINTLSVSFTSDANDWSISASTLENVNQSTPFGTPTNERYADVTLADTDVTTTDENSSIFVTGLINAVNNGPYSAIAGTTLLTEGAQPVGNGLGFAYYTGFRGDLATIGTYTVGAESALATQGSINDSLVIGVEIFGSPSAGGNVFDVSMSFGAQASLLPSAGATANDSVNAGAQSGISQSGSASVDESIQSDNQVNVSQSEGATVNSSVESGSTSSVDEGVNNVVANNSISIGIQSAISVISNLIAGGFLSVNQVGQITVSPDNTSNVFVGLEIAQQGLIGIASEALVPTFIAISSSKEISVFSSATANDSVFYNGGVAISVDNGRLISEFLTIGANNAVELERDLEFNLVLEIESVSGSELNETVSANEVLTHNIESAIRATAQAISDAGIEGASITSISVNGTVFTTGVTLADGRTLKVSFELRVIGVDEEDRTFKINKEDRNYKIK